MKAYLTPEDIDKLLGAAKYLRDRLIIRLLFRLGCRVSELLSIEHATDIDWENRLISIRHLKTRADIRCPKCRARLAKSANFCPGCGQTIELFTKNKIMKERRRRIKIDQESLDMIREYLRRREAEGFGSAKSKRLFALSRQFIYAMLRQVANDAGLNGKILQMEESTQAHYISPHRLRDALATFWAKRDGSFTSQRDLQHHLGHDSFSSTARYFKRAAEESGKTYDKVFGDD